MIELENADLTLTSQMPDGQTKTITGRVKNVKLERHDNHLSWDFNRFDYSPKSTTSLTMDVDNDGKLLYTVSAKVKPTVTHLVRISLTGPLTSAAIDEARATVGAQPHTEFKILGGGHNYTTLEFRWTE